MWYRVDYVVYRNGDLQFRVPMPLWHKITRSRFFASGENKVRKLEVSRFVDSWRFLASAGELINIDGELPNCLP